VHLDRGRIVPAAGPPEPATVVTSRVAAAPPAAGR